MLLKQKSDKVEHVTLVMWSALAMPSSDMVVGVDGKKSFVKNGKFEEMTKYIFREWNGKTIEITTKNNLFRDLEGEIVDLTFDVSFDDFKKVIKTKLVDVQKSKVA